MFGVTTFSEAGGHPVNEDAFGVRVHPEDASCLLVALADGQGGQPGGGRASQLACQITLDTAAGRSVQALLDPANWPALMHQADQVVCDDAEAGYTTLIGFALRDHAIIGASSGDSAVVAFNGSGRCLDLTRQQKKNPPVGCRDAFFTPFAIDLAAPWLILAMSDGVWKYAGWDRVKEAASRFRGQALIDALQPLARLRGSGKFPDDFTVIVIQDRE